MSVKGGRFTLRILDMESLQTLTPRGSKVSSFIIFHKYLLGLPAFSGDWRELARVPAAVEMAYRIYQIVLAVPVQTTIASGHEDPPSLTSSLPSIGRASGYIAARAGRRLVIASLARG